MSNTYSHFKDIPKLGLGLAALGRPDYINLGHGVDIQNNRRKDQLKDHAFKVMDYAYTNGVRYFDVARSYGIAEEILNEWYQSRHPADVFFGSKWGYTYVADWLPDAKVHEVKEHSLGKLQEQWQLSKKLMPKLIMYQVHSATLVSGILSNKDVLDELWNIKEKYKVLIGITTSGPKQTDVIRKALEVMRRDELLIDTYQVTYNILEQGLQFLSQALKKLNRTVLIKEALANGRLIPNDQFSEYAVLYDYLNFLAKKYQVGSDAIALRFVIDSIEPEMVLSGAATVSHLEQNVKCLTFKLTTEEVSYMQGYGVKSSDYWSERKLLNWN